MVADEQVGLSHEDVDVAGAAFHGWHHTVAGVRKGGADCRGDHQDTVGQRDADHQDSDHQLDAASKRT